MIEVAIIGGAQRAGGGAGAGRQDGLHAGADPGHRPRRPTELWRSGPRPPRLGDHGIVAAHADGARGVGGASVASGADAADRGHRFGTGAAPRATGAPAFRGGRPAWRACRLHGGESSSPPGAPRGGAGGAEHPLHGRPGVASCDYGDQAGVVALDDGETRGPARHRCRWTHSRARQAAQISGNGWSYGQAPSSRRSPMGGRMTGWRSSIFYRPARSRSCRSPAIAARSCGRKRRRAQPRS